MKHKNMFRKFKKTGLMLLFAVALSSISLPAYADPAPLEQAANGNANSQSQQSASGQQSTDNQYARQQRVNNALKNDPIVRDIQTIVDFLSGGVGIVVTAMIIVGGIQYSIAGDNQQKLTDAKKRIANALIALALFMFIFAFVQWLIPGGIFG